MAHRLNPSRARTEEIAVGQVVLLFVLPIALLYFKILPISFRIPTLLGVSVLMFGIIRKEKWTAEDFGLSLKTLKKFLLPYVVATIIALGAVLLLAHKLELPPATNWWKNPHFLFIFIIVSFFQEFAFRGFLLPVLKKVFPEKLTIVIINAGLFALMHAIYPFPVLGLPIAFVAGLFFAGMYVRYPNLILVSLSHAVLNFVVVWYGIFTIS